jgi:hypothetical protein
MGDPNGSSYALAADVKSKPARRQAPKPSDQQYCMAATVEQGKGKAPEADGINYTMAAVSIRKFCSNSILTIALVAREPLLNC